MIILEINITVDKKNIDIQSIIILIDKLKDKYVTINRFIIINALFINNINLVTKGIINIIIIEIININIIYELLIPQIIVLIKLD